MAGLYGSGCNGTLTERHLSWRWVVWGVYAQTTHSPLFTRLPRRGFLRSSVSAWACTQHTTLYVVDWQISSLDRTLRAWQTANIVGRCNKPGGLRRLLLTLRGSPLQGRKPSGSTWMPDVEGPARCAARKEKGAKEGDAARVLFTLVVALGVPCGERPRRLPLSQAYSGGPLPVGAVSPDGRTGPGSARGDDGCGHHPLDVALRVSGGPDGAVHRSYVRAASAKPAHDEERHNHRR